MKITDTHVTRIELTADDVDAVLSGVADELYRTGEIPKRGALPAWMVPPSLPPTAVDAVVPTVSRAWNFSYETLRQEDDGAILTIRRSR